MNLRNKEKELEKEQNEKFLSPQEISNLENYLKEERNKLTLFSKPFQTFSLFILALLTIIKNTLIYFTLNLFLFKYLFIIILFWYLLEFFPGPYTSFINKIEFIFQYIFWWIGLGILSSIGLGSGLQTGVLFLFPHIMRVCITAQTCKSIEFNSFNSIWFHDINNYNLFKCLNEPTNDQQQPHFLNVWLLVLIPSFLQATGTAIGEIPPYWVTRAARQAAIDAGEKLEVSLLLLFLLIKI